MVVVDTSGGSGRARLPQELLDVEGYNVAPQGLTLEQVHIYMRHGEPRELPS